LAQISKIILDELETKAKNEVVDRILSSTEKKGFTRYVDEKFYPDLMSKIDAHKNAHGHVVTGKIEKNHAWKFYELLGPLNFAEGLTVEIHNEVSFEILHNN
jgi:hypothetical protein